MTLGTAVLNGQYMPLNNMGIQGNRRKARVA